MQMTELIDKTRNAFDILPTEIFLDIIPNIPFSTRDLQSLSLTCRRFHHLIRTYEASLIRLIANIQFQSGSQRKSQQLNDSDGRANQVICSHHLFPSLTISSYNNLRILQNRLKNLSEIHTSWLHIVSHGPELSWLRGRWEAIHRTGLLILYRIFDAGGHQSAQALLDGLPATSLACLLFKLVASIKILRVHGPEPVNGRFAAGDLLARSDVELCTEEMLLCHGPEFFVAMLREGRAGGSKTRAPAAAVVRVSGGNGAESDKNTCVDCETDETSMKIPGVRPGSKDAWAVE